MIDASHGFMKDGPKNRLRSRDIHRIVDTFKRRLDIPGYSRMVFFEEIEKNEFNLNLPRYIDSQQKEDIQDIEGHLCGGIPARDVQALCNYWAVCPNLKAALFREIRPGYYALAVEKEAVKPAIFGHPQFAAFTAGMNAHFDQCKERISEKLKALKPGFIPKDVILDLSNDLLAHYADMPLIDKYDVYQHLMDYWERSMQDDCYLIAAEGWKAETHRIIEKSKKGREKDRGWSCDLVPKALIVARYFSREQAAIDRLAAELDSVTASMAELEEEHGGEEGAFVEMEKVNRGSVTARLREIRGEREAKDEAAVLDDWLKLAKDEADLKMRLKDVISTTRPCPSSVAATLRSSLWNATASTSAIRSVRRSANNENTYWRNGGCDATSWSNTALRQHDESRVLLDDAGGRVIAIADEATARQHAALAGRRRDTGAVRGLRRPSRRGSNPRAPAETAGR